MQDRERHDVEAHPLPQPTIWPAVMAAGITLLAASLVTNFLVAAGGAALCITALVGWVRELLGEDGEAAGSEQPPQGGADG